MLISPTDLCCVALATKLADPAPSRVCLFIYFLTVLYGMWDLSFWTRDQIHGPCIGSMES